MADTVIGRHAAHAAARIGRRASPSPTFCSSGATAAIRSCRSEVRSCRRRTTRRDAQVLAVTQEGHRVAVAVRHHAHRHRRRWPGAPIRRASSTRRSSTSFSRSSVRRRARSSRRPPRSPSNASLAAGPITVARLVGALPVRQHAPRRAASPARSFAPTSSRARATFARAPTAARASIQRFPASTTTSSSGVDYTIDVSKPTRRTHHAARLQRPPRRAG